MWHSHNFLLLFITIKEYFIISITFIFSIYFLCFVVGKLSVFKFIIFNFYLNFHILLHSSKFYILMIHSVSQIKLWGIKQLFVTINLKFKIKTYFYVRGATAPSYPRVNTLSTRKKYLRSLFNSRN